MSQLGEVGISPVLLQAISQSITATSQNRNPTNALTMDSSTNTNNPTQLQAQVSKPEEIKEKLGVKAMLKIKMAANALSKGFIAEEDKSSYSATSISDLAMANMLTALASQADNTSVVTSGSHTQSVSGVLGGSGSGPSETASQTIYIRTSSGELVKKERVEKTQNVFLNQESQGTNSVDSGDKVTNIGTDIQFATDSIAKPVTDFVTDNSSVDSQANYIIKSKTSDIGSHSMQTQSMPMTLQITSEEASNSGSILTSNNGAEQPGSIQNVVESVFNFPQAGGQMIEFDGKRYILTAPSNLQQGNKFIAIQTSSGPSTSEETDIYTTVGGNEVVSGTEFGEVAQSHEEQVASNLCPICADEISGFHYGIFTCESCKGFFKRTVQNKKSFVCHRQGECEITLENRKKCPACRFAKCLVMGMNLEAIRQDRSRGGRSSYSGLSPLDESKRKRTMKPVQKRPVSSTSMSGDSRLASALSTHTTVTFGKPFVPTVLTDIMNLESLLCDDDIPPNIKAEDFISTNPSVFLSLLQLCELKLYKIVRWARNLPYFANISTDDQILLLQNCWCELLGLTMCWKSIHLTNEIVFFHGQTIDLEKAKLLNLGDLFMCLLAEVEQLKRLKLDQYECVAMKVIILITPDIKGLNNSESLGLQQQKISEALEQYTSGHYKQHPSKYGELLLRLPELSRISFMLKEQLLSWMPLDNTSCGLLYELLKGENMKELV